MIQSGVEVAVSETKRQYRILRSSAEHNTSVRITDEVSLLNWIPHFAVQLLNKMRTGRRWRKPMVQLGEKIWFHKNGEEGINSSVKRRIQGIFVGHHDRTRAIPYIAKSGIVRRFYVLSADIEAHGHTGGCPVCAALASHGKATKPHNEECRERIRTIIERTKTGKARMNAYKDRIAETERVGARKGARVERGAGDVPMEPGNRDDEQVAVRHADASGGDIRENPARRGQNERHPRWQKRIRGSR